MEKEKRLSITNCLHFLSVFILLSCAENSQHGDARVQGQNTDTLKLKADEKPNPNGEILTISNSLSTVYMTGSEFIQLSDQAAKLSFQFSIPEEATEFTLACYKLRGNDYVKPAKLCSLETGKWPIMLDDSHQYIMGGQKLKRPDINKVLDALKALPGNDADKIVAFRPLETFPDDHVHYGINVFPNLQAFRAAALTAPAPIAVLNPSPPASDN